MTDCGERGYIRGFRSIARIIIAGALLCLLALVWVGGRTPAARASGVPPCTTTVEHAPTRPAIHLNRHEGPVGTNLTATVSGWRPGAQVALHFDGRDPKTGAMYVLIDNFWQGAVSSDGTVTTPSLNAPWFDCFYETSNDNTTFKFDYLGGTTAYFVLTSDHGEVSAPLAFTYLPAPTVSLAGQDSLGGVKVGSTLTVSGSGWEPHEPLSLTLYSADPASPGAFPNAARTHAAADAQGNFTTSYPVDAQLRWNTDAMLLVEGNGPRFGYVNEYGTLMLVPAVQPTFEVDRTVVTPGMTITVSGEHWYPQDNFTIKYCAAQLGENGWEDGPDCGKEVNPALGMVSIDANGRMRQQFTIPASEKPGVIMIHIREIVADLDVQPIAVHVVDHLPGWDDIHPRVAALRNTLVGSLPFTIPAVLLLGALAFFVIRRWRMRQKIAG